MRGAQPSRLVPLAGQSRGIVAGYIAPWRDDPLATSEGEDYAPDHNNLRIALLATGSHSLSLPHWASFAPLIGAGFVDTEGATFVSHTTYMLPCDHSCSAARGPGRSKQGLADTIHRFELAESFAAPLNKSIRSASLEMEVAADAAVGDGGGQLKSNWGGYQSSTTIFEGCEDEGEHQRLSGCRQLHALASLAMEVLGELEGGSAGLSHYPDQATRPLAGELHSAYAWLNVNRSSDLNYMHVHDPLRWSGVYFVDAGATVEESHGGRLLFRGGKQAHVDASHSFLAVPPTPGTLWIFPGSVPHAVLGQVVPTDPPRDTHGRSDHAAAATEACARGEAPEAARISVAINFSEALTPKSHSQSRAGRR